MEGIEYDLYNNVHKYPLKDLRPIAKRLGIKGYTRMKKAKLIELIKKAELKEIQLGDYVVLKEKLIPLLQEKEINNIPSISYVLKLSKPTRKKKDEDDYALNITLQSNINENDLYLAFAIIAHDGQLTLFQSDRIIDLVRKSGKYKGKELKDIVKRIKQLDPYAYMEANYRIPLFKDKYELDYLDHFTIADLR